MCNIWKTVPDNYTIAIEQNVRFLRGLYPEKFQQNYILNGRPLVIFNQPFNLKSWAVAIEVTLSALTYPFQSYSASG